MFSGSSFGEHAFAEHEFTPLDTSAFEAFLAEITSERCWLIELDILPVARVGGVSGAFSDAAFGQAGFGDAVGQTVLGEETLRYSTGGYTSQSADSPADTHWQSRLVAPPIVDRQITSRDGIGGLTTVYAEAVLVNSDGRFDALLEDYALDGRRARILVGRIDDAYSDFGSVFTGIVQSATVGERGLQLTLSDGAERLRRAVNEAVYTGAGALEGGDDLTGKHKPVALGEVQNVPAVLVDSAKLIYQVHNGPISDVPNVRDRGIELTKGADYASESDLNTTAPSAGQYRVYKAGGYFRLGATPSGLVTTKVQGDASGAGYVTSTSDIVQRILVNRVGLYSSEIDPASFERLRTAQSAAVGLWAGTEPMSCEAAVESLLYGIGAFGGFSRHGTFTVGIVATAVGETEEATYITKDILKGGVVREPKPAPVEPAVWRVGVGWQYNHAVQTDLAAAVTAANRTFAAEEMRIANAEDSAILSRHRLARELGPIAAHFAVEADGETEADRLLALWGPGHSIYRVPLRNMTALLRDVGSCIRIEEYPRFRFEDGRSVRVLGQRIEGSKVELRVLA